MNPEPFALRRDPKPTRQKFPQEKRRQAALFCGLDDSPGQENLFPTDGRLPAPPADPRPPAPSAAAAPPVFAKQATGDAAAELLARARDTIGRPIDEAEPGQVVQPAEAAHRFPDGTHTPARPAWLLFMKRLGKHDARRIAREEGGRVVCYDHPRQRFAVLVPQLEEIGQ